MSTKFQTNNINKQFPLIMIHTCNKREWYVYEYLVPSLLEQDLPHNNIIVWHDYERIGNLHSCLLSFQWCYKNLNNDEGVWHLQDDVLVCRNFVKRIKELENQDIVNGFCCKNFNLSEWKKSGYVNSKDTWNSFPCIKIKNKYVKNFCDWVYSIECLKQRKYHDWYKTGKMDDSFWREQLIQKNPELEVLNLKPSLVEHIDMLIGGSVINEDRDKSVCNSCYWQDIDLIKQFIDKMRAVGKINQKWVKYYLSRQDYQI